ncbi:hypothetical protein QA596_02085 [Balneolales bacterium ANBcel1]|nr:hypothetical protein [Balneolales bacterium ANBcel1]
MALIILNLSTTTDSSGKCLVSMDVGDTQNTGKTGRLKLHIGESRILEQEVTLRFPMQNVTFEVPGDGRNYTVKAVLICGDEKRELVQDLKFCG